MSDRRRKVPVPAPAVDVIADRMGSPQRQGAVSFTPRPTDDGIVWEYSVDPAHFNPHGVLHGGIVMTLLDTAMGYLVAQAIAANGRINAAAQMSVSFLAPVRAGTLRARARIVKVGRRLAVVEATAWNEGDEVAATATATHALLP